VVEEPDIAEFGDLIVASLDKVVLCYPSHLEVYLSCLEEIVLLEV
jgi:hypothetical protein